MVVHPGRAGERRGSDENYSAFSHTRHCGFVDRRWRRLIKPAKAQSRGLKLFGVLLIGHEINQPASIRLPLRLEVLAALVRGVAINWKPFLELGNNNALDRSRIRNYSAPLAIRPFFKERICKPIIRLPKNNVSDYVRAIGALAYSVAGREQ